MAQQRNLLIADQRAAAPGLRWLTLAAPELAHSVRPGQYLLVRCAEPGSYDPLLRRALFVAAAEPALGQIGLLYAPNERGLAWLARGQAGDEIDIIGPFGHPLALGQHTRTLLLIGQGPGLAALLFLARSAAAKGCAVTLLAGALAGDAPIPAFLLPGEIEYQGGSGPATGLLDGAPASPHPLVWADQVAAALPLDQAATLRDAIRAQRYRLDRGFASVLMDGPIICGVGACGVCAIELRKGARMLCSDGPAFDLRDL